MAAPAVAYSSSCRFRFGPSNGPDDGVWLPYLDGSGEERNTSGSSYIFSPARQMHRDMATMSGQESWGCLGAPWASRVSARTPPLYFPRGRPRTGSGRGGFVGSDVTGHRNIVRSAAGRPLQFCAYKSEQIWGIP